MITPGSKKAAVVLTAALTLTATGMAGAQTADSEVITQVGDGTRQLRVTNLAGEDLTELSLTPQQASPFVVRVTDTGLAPDDFTVSAVLNNLYGYTVADGSNYNNAIASADVSVGYAATPVDAVGALLDLDPNYLINSAVGTIDCADISSILGLDAAAQLLDPVCTLLTIAGNGPVPVNSVPLNATPLEDVNLTSLLTSALPIALAANDTGAFTQPDCANGIGLAAATANAANCVTAGATPRAVLTGTPLTGALSGTLDALLDGVVGNVADPTTINAIISSLQASGDTAVADLGARLAQYTPAELTLLFDETTGLFDILPGALNAADILNLTGVWSSFPTLTVNPDVGTLNGEYRGTITLTLT